MNNGRWHQVTIETDIHNIRCIVDMREKIVEIPSKVPRVAAFTGMLYVGGVPDRYRKIVFAYIMSTFISSEVERIIFSSTARSA